MIKSEIFNNQNLNINLNINVKDITNLSEFLERRYEDLEKKEIVKTQKYKSTKDKIGKTYYLTDNQVSENAKQQDVDDFP